VSGSDLMRALVLKSLEIRLVPNVPGAATYELHKRGLVGASAIVRGSFDVCAARALVYPTPAETDAAFARSKRNGARVPW
jgi:hypothetical protein